MPAISPATVPLDPSQRQSASDSPALPASPSSTNPRIGSSYFNTIKQISPHVLISALITGGVCKYFNVTSPLARAGAFSGVSTIYLIAGGTYLFHQYLQSEAQNNKQWRNTLSDGFVSILGISLKSHNPPLELAQSDKSTQSYEQLLANPNKERALSLHKPAESSDAIEDKLSEGLENVIYSNTIDYNKDIAFIITCKRHNKDVPDFTLALHGDNQTLHLLFPKPQFTSWKLKNLPPESMLEFISQLIYKHSNHCFDSASKMEHEIFYNIDVINLDGKRDVPAFKMQ